MTHYPTFGGDEVAPTPPAEAEIVVMPFCYEASASYGSGSGNGPLHILEASAQLEALDEETLVNWTERRIHTIAPLFPEGEPEAAVMAMKAAAETVFARGRFPLILGGDHAAAIGPIMAAAAAYPNVGVLQIDAHLDLRETWNGSRWNHGCVMRRAMDDLNLPAAQVGIRAIAAEEADFLQERRLRPFFAHDLSPCNDDWIGEVVCALPEHVYLSLDLDGLDPSVIPGTGTPEPGGLSYRQVVRLIRTIGARKRVVGADITELVKIPGTQVSEYTAAKLAAKIIIHCA